MGKSTSLKVDVPAHLFESMLRTAMNSEGSLSDWKDALLHWEFSTDKLNQFIDALKEGAKKTEYKTSAKETMEFIESKLKNRKD
ncbi:MAG: hypothetical protein IPM74_14320 [Crocinitomicaceae bacterium]|nr:hypothetical protein [Crocinitomicaceae bacterium]MBK8927044.1 hypothetical protein [Crocinitomicaceae bacterium]